MIRNTLFASVIALGAVGVAQAQDAGPRMIGTGDNAQIVYAEPNQNVVGGGSASLTGSGDTARLAYDTRTLEQLPAGQVATMSGTGDNAQIAYAPAPASSASMRSCSDA